MHRQEERSHHRGSLTESVASVETVRGVCCHFNVLHITAILTRRNRFMVHLHLLHSSLNYSSSSRQSGCDLL